MTGGGRADGDAIGVIGGEIRRYGEVDSTNDLAFDHAAAGCPEGTTVVAESQRAGRGRRGRSWYSPGGANLYFSIVLRPSRPRREWPEIPWVVAGAVAAGLARAGVRNLSIKSPNDVLAGGRKIAGVLLENRVGGSVRTAVVAGVGLNVNLPRRLMPEGLRETATSVEEETGAPAERETLLLGLLSSIDGHYRTWELRGGEEVRRRLEGEGLRFVGFDVEGRG